MGRAGRVAYSDPISGGFDAGLPNGFTRIREAASHYNFGIGVWFSPWGGYEENKERRVAAGRKQGFEIVKDGFALSGPLYYQHFEQACLDMMTKYGANQFKLDGTGNADQVFPGSAFDSDFSAAIHLIERMRQQNMRNMAADGVKWHWPCRLYTTLNTPRPEYSPAAWDLRHD